MHLAYRVMCLLHLVLAVGHLMVNCMKNFAITASIISGLVGVFSGSGRLFGFCSFQF